MGHCGFCCGMERVIREKQVGYALFFKVINGVVGEKSHVHDINFLKGAEQKLWQGVSVAVLENGKLSAVVGGGLYVCDLCVAAHKGTVKHGF